MYSVDCTPTWIIPVPKAVDSSTPVRSESAGGFLSHTGGSDIGAPVGSARRFSSFSSLAAALKGERTTPLLSCLRPVQSQSQDQQAVLLPHQDRIAQQDQIIDEHSQQVPQQKQGSALVGSAVRSQLQPDFVCAGGKTSYSASLQDWFPQSGTDRIAPTLSRNKKHQRSTAGSRGKFAADPYRVGGRAAGPRMNISSTSSSTKPPCPSRSTPAGEEDLAAITGEGAADTEDEGGEHFNSIHGDDNSGNAGYEALQNALACVVASGRSTELLVWGVRCLIERDFPCLYKKHGRTLTGLELPLDLPAKGIAPAEGEMFCLCGSAVQSKGAVSMKKDATAASTGNDGLLLQEQCTAGSKNGKVGVKINSNAEDDQDMCYNCGAPRASLMGSVTDCSCNNGNCLGRQIVVVSMEGHRQRDRRVLKWVRHNLLHSGDVVVLITAWERAEEPKYLRVPGMILSSSVDASSYNFTMATRLTSRVKQLGAALLSDCRVYPLVVPLARVTKAPVGNLLCQSARELQADLLVVGSHGHTSLRQVLCGSVSRHVRAHAPCRVVMPRV